MKRRKVKKKVWGLLIALLFIGIAIYGGIKTYQDYKYKQTNEYKLLEIGYTKEESDTLLKTLNKKQLNKVINQEKNNDLINFIN